MKKVGSIIVSFFIICCLFVSCSANTKAELGFYQSSKAEEFGEYRYIGITLSENNACEVSFSMSGDFFYGTYRIEKDTLICHLNKLQGEYIKDLETDIEYYFEICENNELRFEKVVGTVGKYYSTIDGSEYIFEEQLSHFEKGETFVLNNNVE